MLLTPMLTLIQELKSVSEQNVAKHFEYYFITSFSYGVKMVIYVSFFLISMSH
jgi:hypothetical protein